LRGRSWYYDFWYRGVRYTGCIGPVSKTVARAIETTQKAAVIEHRFLPTTPHSPLFEAFLGEYLAYYKAHRRPRSVARHAMAAKALRPFFATYRLDEISPIMVERYKKHRTEAGRSGVTINRELSLLKHLFTMAVQWGVAQKNPVTQVHFFREDHGRTRCLTGAEEARLLACCSPTLRPVVLTALQTGLRKSELLALRWEHVDLVRQVLTVEAAYAKNGEARCVPKTRTLAAALRDLQGQAGPATAVFLTQHQTPYIDVSKVFRAACRRAGVVDLRFHDLRHTFASRLVMAGVDLATVQQLLGHKHITMTLRYIHLAPGHVHAALARLDPQRERVPAAVTTEGAVHHGEGRPCWLCAP
jgi:integrase